MIGKTISHYRILEKIGEGGMGVVYKAEDTKLKRTVALKFLPKELTQDEEAKQRFIQEAQAAAALDHPNICTVYEIDDDEGQTFIVMAYVEGQSLREKIKSGPLEVNKALDIAIQVGAGLQKAHDKGIIHRDIKPANIMLTEENQAKIMDFGLVKLEWGVELTKTATIMGTVAYMSPEQAKGEKVDNRTDIWSFGALLYEMLTAQRPFMSQQDQALIYSILNEYPELITAIKKDIPSSLETVVQKCLEKTPENRYKDVATLILELKSIEAELVKATSSLKTAEEGKAPSIAVLPFVDMSSEKDQEYFCDGLSESIINSLTQIKDFRVVSRTSAFSFKGKETDIREIGNKLNVNQILEGSVQKAGYRLRITAQLINVEDGYHLWSERFDRDLSDVFEIQDEISVQIVNKLKVKLAGQEKDMLVKRYTEDLEAYNLYLKGRYYWNKTSPDDFHKGITYFQEAVQKDPAYALAYTGMAFCHIGLGWYYHQHPMEAFPKAREAVDKALEMDDHLSEGHTSLGVLKMVYDRDWDGAKEAFHRAIELNPGYSLAHSYYSMYLAVHGRRDESIAEGKRALELDPLTFMMSMNLGMRYYYARDFDAAIDLFQKGLDMDPDFKIGRFYISFAYTQKRMYDEALDEINKALEGLGRKNPMLLAFLGAIYGFSNQRDEAIKVLDELLVLSEEKYVAPFLMAILYISLGQKDQAFDWLERSYDQYDHVITFLKVEPCLESIRSDPRYGALLKKMRLSK